MIPPLFHSVETDSPFESCCHCERPLCELDIPYVINKQFENGECVLEFAMCQDCKITIHNEMSVESREAIMNFFDQRANMDQRSADLEGQPTEAWLEDCVTCGYTPKPKEAYTLGGMAFEKEFISDPYPLMICGRCQIATEELLSEESRKRRDRFRQETFEGPPSDLAPLPKQPSPMMI